MSRITSKLRLAILALVVLGLSGLVRAEGVLKFTPADAIVVVKIKNLQEANNKLMVLIDKLGLANFNPDLADPMATLLKKAKVSAGLDKGGDMALFVIPKEGAKPDVVMLVPVSDYNTFIGNFQGAAAEGDITSFKSEGQQMYAAHWGNFAALTDHKDALSKPPAGITLPAVCQKAFDQRDFAMAVNMPVAGPKALNFLKSVNEKYLPEMNKQFEQNPAMAGQAKMMKLLVPLYVQLANRFMSDANGVVLGANLDKEGISTTLAIEFKPESYMGKLAAAMKGNNQTQFAGLPDNKYILFGSMELNPDATGKMLDDIAAEFKASMQQQGLKTDGIDQMLADVKKPLKSEKYQNFGLLMPSGPMGQGSLIQMVQVTAGDAKALADAQAKILQDQLQVMKDFGNENAGTVEVTANAKTVGNVSLSHWEVKPGEDANAAMVKQLMAMVYGPGGVSGYFGVVDDGHSINSLGLDDTALGAVIDAVKTNADPLAKRPNVQMLLQHLPQNRVGVMFVEVGNLVQMVSDLAKQFGHPLPVQIQPDLPPVGTAIAVDGNAILIDSYTPTDLVSSLIVTGMQAYMGMQQQRQHQGGL